MITTISVWIDKVNVAMGKTVAYFTVIMAVVMFLIVVLRYGFNLGSIALQESITYMHAAVFLLGSAYTFQQNGHVRVDVFYRRFSKKTRCIVDLLGSLLLMLPIAIYLSIVCHHYVFESWSILEGSREPGGLPFVYVLKSFLLIFAYSLILQAFSEAIKNMKNIFLLQREIQ